MYIAGNVKQLNMLLEKQNKFMQNSRCNSAKKTQNRFMSKLLSHSISS